MNPSLLVTIGGVLAASVIGSLHCAGMCGAFVAMAVGLETNTGRARLHVLYNLGRLCSYASLGALAGGIGQGLDLGASVTGLQSASALLAAGTMIAMGALPLVCRASGRAIRLPLPKPLERAVTFVYRRASALAPGQRAFLIGLCTCLLPCGWLYAFAILAAGTANPLAGALVMSAFWLGTLPALVAVGAGIRELTGRLGGLAPVLMSVVIITLGCMTALNRVRIEAPLFGEARAHPVSTLPGPHAQHACCEDGSP